MTQNVAVAHAELLAGIGLVAGLDRVTLAKLARSRFSGDGTAPNALRDGRGSSGVGERLPRKP